MTSARTKNIIRAFAISIALLLGVSWYLLVRSQSSINPIIPPSLGAGSMLKFAFVQQNDVNSETAIQLQANHLHAIIPDWYFLTESNCSIDSRVFPKIQTTAQDNGLEIFPLYQNHDQNGLYSEQTRSILLNQNLRSCTQAELLRQLIQDQASGVVLDFTVTADLSTTYTDFVKELRTLIGTNDLKIFVLTDAYNDHLTELAYASDGVIVKLFRSTNDITDELGPAPFDWFSTGLNRAIDKIPSNKLMFAIGQFAAMHDADNNVQELSYTAAAYEAKTNAIQFLDQDTDTQNTAARQDQQALWLLGPAQAQQELQAMARASFIGIGIYRLGTEHPIVWELLDSPYSQLPDPLPTPPYVYHKTNGEIISVLSRPDSKNGLPHGFVLGRAGPELASNSILLTFDDGPDPEWTPKITELLNKERIPAAFFVVGEQIKNWPEATLTLNNPLFTIGNHSYNHPHLDELTDQEVIHQVTSTEQMIQDTLGVRPRFFRLPYDVNVMPTHPATIHVIDVLDQQDYFLVGAGIDSRDWAMPNVDEAVNAIMQGLSQGKHIIVFHDGGGDRSQTIVILEKLIERARNDGYDFIDLNNLVSS